MPTGYFDSLFNQPPEPAPWKRPLTTGLSRTGGKAQSDYLGAIDAAESEQDPGLRRQLIGGLSGLQGPAERERDEAAGLVGPRHLDRTPAKILGALGTGLGVLGAGYGLAGGLGMLGGATGASSGLGNLLGKAASGAKSIFGPEALSSVFGGVASDPSPLTIPTADPATWDVDSIVRQASDEGSLTNTFGTGATRDTGWLDSMVQNAAEGAQPYAYGEESGNDLFPYNGDGSELASPYGTQVPEVYEGTPTGGNVDYSGIPDVEDPYQSANTWGANQMLRGQGAGMSSGPMDYLSKLPLSAIARLIGGAGGAAAGAVTGGRTSDLGRQQLALQAPSQARFEAQSAAPAKWAPTDIRALADRMANVRGRSWSQTVGNPAESPAASIATDRDLAQLAYTAETHDKEMQAQLDQADRQRQLQASGLTGLSPAGGYATVGAGQQEQNRAVTGGIGSIIDTLFNPGRQDQSQKQIADLLALFEAFTRKG